METLTKSEMINHLMDELAMSRQESRLFVDTFFAQLTDHLKAGYHIKLSGFGNFELKQKTARPGRNPKIGEVVTISARRVVTFKAGQKMRQCIAENFA